MARLNRSNPIIKVRAMGYRPTQAHRDKSKYTRKVKHKNGKIS